MTPLLRSITLGCSDDHGVFIRRPQTLVFFLFVSSIWSPPYTPTFSPPTFSPLYSPSIQMENALTDDRRIKVDFSQSVSKLWNQFRRKGTQGTVRSNIDPINQYSEDEIWKSLERCQLKDVVASKPEKLDAPVADNGDHWSAGQKQLLCLGRVMLKKSQPLFMDEATAFVDSQTDDVIQKIIREDFTACTIISIAHRIPTIMDCDRVLVIDACKAKEFDSPTLLLARPSLFGALVQEYANRSSGF